ncbi:iron chelate uptake ABC transporter family permease subunit [Paremcibacter congregatus]|uniref:iron chelate uptake ABC transporter family permease subunit n=1 Tax=Paremcibacter congregatus TaxID=2043170 RepID=UPI003A92F258
MIDGFILNAMLAGIMVAMAAGPLGCFLVWRRMAYFGDTISHSALMGVGLGVALGTQSPWVIVATCAVISGVLLLLQKGGKFSTDTLLGILAHSSLSIGLIVIALQETLRQDMMFFLIGDILAIGPEEIMGIAVMMTMALGGLILIWKPLLSITVHEDLAQVEGVNVLRTKIIYMLLIALLVAFAMKVIGALLITSLMIIPAAAARNIARSPVQMAIYSMLIGSLAVVMGIMTSSLWDLPAGPSIVLSALILFLIGRGLPHRYRI